MRIDIDMLSEKVKIAVPTAITKVYPEQNQIIIGFTNRPDVEVALLTPYDQQSVKKGWMDDDHVVELLMSVKRIANVGKL